MKEVIQKESTISQRSFVGGPLFRFHEDHLEYQGNFWGFKVKYGDMAGQSEYGRRNTRDLVPKIALFYLISLSLALMFGDKNPHIGPEGFHWLIYSTAWFIGVAIAICTPLYVLTHKEFTVIPTTSGEILVVRDRQHDAIIQKLQTARIDCLRRLSAPDPTNSPTEELAKLKWLHKQGAISDDDYLNLCSRQQASVDEYR